MSLAKLKNALFDDCVFLFEIFLPRRQKEREFCVSKDFDPGVDVVGRAQSVTPNGVFQRRHVALCRFWDMTKSGDWSAADIVESERQRRTLGGDDGLSELTRKKIMIGRAMGHHALR